MGRKLEYVTGSRDFGAKRPTQELARSSETSPARRSAFPPFPRKSRRVPIRLPDLGRSPAGDASSRIARLCRLGTKTLGRGRESSSPSERSVSEHPEPGPADPITARQIDAKLLRPVELRVAQYQTERRRRDA